MLHLASSFYLYNKVEKNFFELSDEDRYEHLEENAWEPFAYDSGYTIDSHISDLAHHISGNHYPERNLWQRITNCLQNKFTYLRRKTND